jgi:hypothetical protein
MGAFDDAIREHLELRRKQGVSEEDLKRQEEEALGRGGPRAAWQTEEPSSDGESHAADEPAQTPEGVRAAIAEPDESELEPDIEAAPIADLDEEPEPDEVLPVEALESSLEEDVLEETPDFLEESPEQDRLWFEQRSPKDFDFGD